MSMNRKHNASNPYQGPARKVLCVCSAGLLRSPTMANVLHREFGYNTRACGSDPAFALIPIDEVLVLWADEIVFSEAENLEQVQANGIDIAGCEITILDLPDSYEYMDKYLQRFIKERYEELAL